MSTNLNQPFEEFLWGSFAEYRASLPDGKMSQAMWKEHVKRGLASWLKAKEAKKPKKKPIADEAAWIASLVTDPALAGVQVMKEVEACRFWCRNQTPPVMMSRRRLVNWLNRADRVVGTAQSAAPLPNPGPSGWLAWARENLPDWRRFADEESGTPLPAWDKLSPEERHAISSQMKRGA